MCELKRENSTRLEQTQRTECRDGVWIFEHNLQRIFQSTSTWTCIGMCGDGVSDVRMYWMCDWALRPYIVMRHLASDLNTGPVDVLHFFHFRLELRLSSKTNRNIFKLNDLFGTNCIIRFSLHLFLNLNWIQHFIRTEYTNVREISSNKHKSGKLKLFFSHKFSADDDDRIRDEFSSFVSENQQE